MRVINAVVLSRGSQNEQTLAQARKFLSENRLSVLIVFKRSARLGVLENASFHETIDDLAAAYIVLISISGFLDVSRLAATVAVEILLHPQSADVAIVRRPNRSVTSVLFQGLHLITSHRPLDGHLDQWAYPIKCI